MLLVPPSLLWTPSAGASYPEERIWSNSLTFTLDPGTDNGITSGISMGLIFKAAHPGNIKGVWIKVPAVAVPTVLGSGAGYQIKLWASSGQLGPTLSTGQLTTTGWQRFNFSSPIAIAASTPYIISWFENPDLVSGNNQVYYPLTAGTFASDVVNGNLTAYSSANAAAIGTFNGQTIAGNGLYSYQSSGAMPFSSFNSSNYGIDPIYQRTS